MSVFDGLADLGNAAKSGSGAFSWQLVLTAA